MGLKDNASFARFLRMGAIGSERVALDLRDNHGHRPIELEGFAMSNKVWQTKVKRLRLPDIGCLHCGLRVESRAKTKLEMILSHSDVDGREWHAGGMRDGDLYAFIRVDFSDEPPVISAPIYVTRQALAETEHMAKLTNIKAASEGSEKSMVWPTYVSSRDGYLEDAPAQLVPENDEKLIIMGDDGRKLTYWQWRNWERRRLYVEPGDTLQAGLTVVAGVVDLPTTLTCPGATWDPAEDLHSADKADRYVAVKAAGFLDRQDLGDLLIQIAEDDDTDWRIRLEARASLVRLGVEEQIQAILDSALDEGSGDDGRIECVFVLSATDHAEAAEGLTKIAGTAAAPSEIRSAAVWGLGQGVHKDSAAAAPFIGDEDELVALHAVSSIHEIDDALASELVAQLDAEPRLAEASATLLLRHGRIEDLVAAARGDGDARLLALRALGDVSRDELQARCGNSVVEEFQLILEPMWRGQHDWIRQDHEEDLDELDAERLNFGVDFA